jgi:hypothetical protein
VVAQAWNPSSWELYTGDWEFQASLGYIARSFKIQNNNKRTSSFKKKKKNLARIPS